MFAAAVLPEFVAGNCWRLLLTLLFAASKCILDARETAELFLLKTAGME
jgi:hypothetical protein